MPPTPSTDRPVKFFAAARRLLVLLPAAALLAGPLAPLPATAATATASCRDGANLTWKTKVTWGAPYVSSDGKTRVAIDLAGWSTTRSGSVPTDSTVKTYDGSGKLVQTLTRTSRFNYQSGTRYDSRNPTNPISAPGKVRVTVKTGVDGDGRSDCTTTFIQPKTATKPTPAPPSKPPVSSTGADRTPGWLSGASSAQASDGSYGAWRGSPVEIVGFWANDPALYPIGPKISGCSGCGEHQKFNGPIDMGIAPPNWSSWAKEANGEHDAFWTAVFRNAKKMRAGKGTTYIRPWYEYNGNWFPYSVKPGEDASFRKAFERVDAIQNREFPAAKLMLGVAASSGASVANTWPARGVDVLNIDFYNNWPFCTTTACFNNKIENGAGSSSLEDLRRLAAKKGVPIAIGEWSNQGAKRSDYNGGGGESPQFIRDWNSWLKKNAGTAPGKVLYEINFNLWSDEFEMFTAAMKTSSLQPKTAEEYRRLW